MTNIPNGLDEFAECLFAGHRLMSLLNDPRLIRLRAALVRALARPEPEQWLFLVIGLFLVYRYRWILDDSAIYFRYVDNFLFLDRGLVFNRGEFVEGQQQPTLDCPSDRSPGDTARLLVPTTIRFFVAYSTFWYSQAAFEPRARREAGTPHDERLTTSSTAYCVASYFSSGSEAPLMQLAALLVALYVLGPGSIAIQVRRSVCSCSCETSM